MPGVRNPAPSPRAGVPARRPASAGQRLVPAGDPAKSRQILLGARAVFMAEGYERATVDAIAARAGVSKATVYSHFADKQALFVACAVAESAEMRGRLADILATATGDPAHDLAQVGEALLRHLVRPSTLALRRILVAEAGRFPELGRVFYDDAACSVCGRIAPYLRRCADQGLLAVEDEHLAAIQLFALVISDLQWRLELGSLTQVTGALLHRAVDDGVRTFLRAYRP